jgi:phosphoadenosine phosphosulfate reductase
LQTLLPAEELLARNEAFEAAQPAEIVRWALEESGLDRIAIASAFQAEGTVVMHLATQIRPDIPILFLETGFHFAETLAFKQRLKELFDLNVVDLTGEYTVDSQAERFGPRLYERDPDLCCRLNKVEPFNVALREYDAWVTGMRRDSAWTRAKSSLVMCHEVSPGHPIVRVNPIANWTQRDAWAYLKEHGIPHNPLYDLGYASIGCAPCTRMVFPGEDERAGRWSGTGKIECGIQPEAGAANGEIGAGTGDGRVPSPFDPPATNADAAAVTGG